MQVQSRRADVTFDLIFTIYIKLHLGHKQLKKTYFLPLFGEYHIGPKGIELKGGGGADCSLAKKWVWFKGPNLTWFLSKLCHPKNNF